MRSVKGLLTVDEQAEPDETGFASDLSPTRRPTPTWVVPAQPGRSPVRRPERRELLNVVAPPQLLDRRVVGRPVRGEDF